MADDNDQSKLTSDWLGRFKDFFMAHKALESAGGGSVTIPGASPNQDTSAVAKAAKDAGDRMEADKAAKAARDSSNRVKGPASK